MVRIGENYYIYSVGKNLANVIGIPWIYVVCGWEQAWDWQPCFSAVLYSKEDQENPVQFSERDLSIC